MAAHRFRSGTGLMVLDTPLLKVSRPVAACSRCRAAKIKCDGKLPACSACEKTGKSAECASANDNFARGKERSYVSTLETKIEKLERRLREVQQRKSSVISMSEVDTEQVRAGAQALRETNTPKNQRAAKRKEARDIDELVSDFGYLTVNASARDYHGFTSFMSYARLVLSACSKDRLPAGMRVPYPPRTTATVTIQHYLDNIFTLLPFFDETSLYYAIDSVYRSLDDSSIQVSDFSHWQVRMILAITNAFLSEQRGDQYYMEGVGHVSTALDLAESVLKPGTIQSVQALLFLVEYALMDPHHFDAWSLIGAASRAMIDLGLHQDPPKGSVPSRAKLEIRRRVFQCVYMLDRSSAIVQTRSFTFSDDSSNVINPFSKSQTPSTSSGSQQWLKTLDHAVDLIALRQIQSKWYYDIFQTGREQWADPYPYIWQTYHSMTSWFNNISPNTTEPIRAFFELELLYSYIYILGSSPRVHKPAPYSQTLLFEHCVSYAALLNRLLHSPKHLAPVTFDDNMRAYMTGMQLLDVLVKHRDQLISGVAPEPPHLPPGAPPAPGLPNVQTEPNVNLLRTINAINQISESLKIFGQRWGFSNWKDDFERAVEPMLKALDSRLWELGQAGMDQHRRPSHVLHGSSGSIVTVESLSRHSSQASSHPGYAPSLTGPQLRAMRSSSAGIYAPLPYGMQDSPPYSSAPMGPPMGNSPSSSNQSPPTQHPPYAAPPPPANYEDPSRQFASWSGLSSADARHQSLQIGSPGRLPPSQ
ncbi:Fungal specific transcription factor domain-containing protein 59 [Elsinoe fawcettii]|nr:Fungal specific transcription factor domain-containing protein 59 [Elsinoe fawcettii]